MEQILFQDLEVRTAPELTLTSSASTENQVVCDLYEAIDNIVYELGPGTDNVTFTWTSGALNVLVDCNIKSSTYRI